MGLGERSGGSGEVYEAPVATFLSSSLCSRLRILLYSVDGMLLFGGEIGLSRKLDIQELEGAEHMKLETIGPGSISS